MGYHGPRAGWDLSLSGSGQSLSAAHNAESGAACQPQPAATFTTPTVHLRRHNQQPLARAGRPPPEAYNVIDSTCGRKLVIRPRRYRAPDQAPRPH